MVVARYLDRPLRLRPRRRPGLPYFSLDSELAHSFISRYDHVAAFLIATSPIGSATADDFIYRGSDLET